jgi:colanic acid biosynthesis glycosyl transferase WcaI
MRVLFLTPYFPPETGAAPARALHLARALLRAGHEVRVVTGLPNHPSGVVQAGYRDAAGREEVVEGVPVRRVWLHATPRKSAFTRLANHLSFAVSALGPALGGPRPDVVLVTTPPLFHGLTAWLAARWRGAVLVSDCRDDWPHAAIALGEMRPGLVADLLEGVARFFQRRSARVLVVTPGMRAQLASRGHEERRLVFLPNGADTELFRPAAARPAPAPGRPFTVLYAGTHGLVHGMEALLDAAGLLRGENVTLRFVGDGVAKEGLVRRAEAERLEHCSFEPSVPPAALVGMLHEADACVATTRAGAFPGETIPVKLFDYLACGCPVVAAVGGDAAAMLEASGGGLVVPPGDGAAIAGALRRLRDDAGLRARLAAAGPAFVAREYSRAGLGERLVSALADAVLEARGRAVEPRPGGTYGPVKRLFDVLLAGLGLLLLSPLLLLLALAVRLDSPGPALFRQRRSGRGSSEFVLLKFRSMAVGTPDLATHLVDPSAVRVTRVGSFLRRTSLDELPQLWNVLRGDMSLVGPRPALYNQQDLIAMRRDAGIDALRPGLTGWAQINGRDEIPMDQKVGYDREYLERASFAFDLGILVRTALTLFHMRGVR